MKPKFQFNSKWSKCWKMVCTTQLIPLCDSSLYESKDCSDGNNDMYSVHRYDMIAVRVEIEYMLCAAEFSECC
jgi:hypothetical protein